jgi:hypothetical protein
MLIHQQSPRELNDITDVAFLNSILQERKDSLNNRIDSLLELCSTNRKSYKLQGGNHMERYVYVNGVFFDRVSNTAEEMAKSLGKKIDRVIPYNCAICGPSEKVYLVD